MNALDRLRLTPEDYQLKYCWARAVEWKMLPAFAAQPLLPVLLLLYPWKKVILGVVAVNFVWNLVFCSAAVSLPLAGFALVWTKLKWYSMIGVASYFIWRHQWFLAGLAIFTPIVAAILGNLILRSPVGLIQEFFMLQLGHMKTEPSPEVERYLSRSAGK